MDEPTTPAGAQTYTVEQVRAILRGSSGPAFLAELCDGPSVALLVHEQKPFLAVGRVDAAGAFAMLLGVAQQIGATLGVSLQWVQQPPASGLVVPPHLRGSRR